MNSKTYSVIVLLVLIVGEVSGILGQQLECDFWFVPIIVSVVFSFLLAIVAWKHKHLRPNSGILANLVSSTISPSWLGIAFLIVFISHFTWWMDVVIEFFKPVSDERYSWYLLFFISSCGLIITGWFFPEGGLIPKDNKTRVVFFSGISLVPSGANGRKVEYSKFNIIPIVRMLQTVFDENGQFKGKPSKLVILNSDAKENLNVGNSDYEYPVLTGILTGPNPVGSSGFWKKDAEHLSIKKTSDDRTTLREEKLRNIIKDAALIEFPDKKEEIEALDICFTTPCDYDLFEECYTVLDEAVRHEDEPNAQLCFNLTPGTGIVGSLMTLFSIDADRLLFYYAQFTSDYRSNHERVQEAKKEKIHLESLSGEPVITSFTETEITQVVYNQYSDEVKQV